MPRNPPAGFHTLTPISMVADPDRLIAFVEEALGGEVVRRFHTPDGSVAHVEVRIGDSLLMIGPASEEYPAFPAMVCVYLDDVDASYAMALAAGATSLRQPEDQFYGDRSSAVVDADGNQWWLTTRLQDLSREEIAQRAQHVEHP